MSRELSHCHLGRLVSGCLLVCLLLGGGCAPKATDNPPTNNGPDDSPTNALTGEESTSTDEATESPESETSGESKAGTAAKSGDEPVSYDPPADSPSSESSTNDNPSANKPDSSSTGNPAANTDAPPVADPNRPNSDEPKPEGAPKPEGENKPADDEAANEVPDDHPFARRIAIPDFPQDAAWLNTSGPLRKQDLKGKFVILDFWTYCCINCMHILPELKKLEHAYPKELVVIGVHSAKFDTEKDSKNIEEAILRYEIEHPVVNDEEHEIWNAFGVNSWPTVLLVDPQGFAIWGTSGEITFDQVNEVLKLAMPYYREKGLLDETPIKFDLLADRQTPTPLRFPGKVLADEAGGRLFISDSNHNRIVVASPNGELLDVIGSGQIGKTDGTYSEASFDHPQGVALHGSTLYVADTENHLLRKVDLEKKTVETIAGVGEQARSAWPGLDELTQFDDLPERWVGPPKTTGINSPWALWVHEDSLYIAMAGPHQIWRMPLDESEIGPYAGNGREDIVDGPLLPKQPYARGFASFAQPSGLTSDGTWLYVADSEGSSIRAVPFDPEQEVRTVIGTADLPYGRLFTFGDKDGDRREARLQHVLGVTFHDGKLFVADTYNNKIKVVDAETGEVRTLAGTGKPGSGDEPAEFDEPAGIAYAGGKLYVADTNNHAIRVVDAETGAVTTLEIQGLAPPAKTDSSAASPKKTSELKLVNPIEHNADPVKLVPENGRIELRVEIKLPEGWKVNDLATMKYKVELEGDAGPVARDQAVTTTLDKPALTFAVPLNVADSGEDTVRLGFNYFYCQEGDDAVCKIGSARFTVPITIAPDGESSQVTLTHAVDE